MRKQEHKGGITWVKEERTNDRAYHVIVDIKKMELQTVFILILGLASVIANPAKETSSAEKPYTSLTKNSEPEFKQTKELLNEIESVTSNTEVIENMEPIVDLIDETPVDDGDDREIDIVIEENASSPLEEVPVPQSNVEENADFPLEAVPAPQSNFDQGFSMIKYLYRYALDNNNVGDIMGTAKGFIPRPIFRRKQNRRRFAVRRQYNRNPYRRFRFVYPYYPLYRRSSLRFY